MSIDLMSAVWKDDYYQQSDKAKLLVALAIADNANSEGYAFPSVDFLARKARTSIRGVQEAFRALVKDGKIQIQEGQGRNGTNLYRVIPPQPLHPAAISPRNEPAVKAPVKPPVKAAADCTQIIRNHQEPSKEPSLTVKTKHVRFAPPSLSEVTLLFEKSGGPPLEAEKFFHYYESNGWRVGKNPMRSVTGAVGGWVMRWRDSHKQPATAIRENIKCKIVEIE